MPIYRRLPKRGFTNAMFTKDYNEVSVGRVQAAVEAGRLDGKETVTEASLVAAGVLRRARDGVRLLANGEINTKMTFEVAGASKAAIEKVEKAGGSVTVLAPKQEAAAE